MPNILSQMVQTSAFEQGISQLSDHDWAETRGKINQIGAQVTDSSIEFEAIPSHAASNAVSNLRTQIDQDVVVLLNLHEQEHEVAHDQSLDFMVFTELPM